MWEVTKSVQTKIPSDKTHFVIDSGALLQRIPWQRGIMYDNICEIYVKYVERHYGKQATIVFDGYQHGPSTKAQSRRSWTKGKTPGKRNHESQEGHFSFQ